MAIGEGATSAAAETLAALRGGGLAGVRELRLANLGLSKVPDEVYGLADTLRLLDLGGNRLQELPADFGRLQHLEVLFASGNPFDALPSVLGECPR